ncbi:MAG TPA: diaminopimelate decarboxylase [Bryobacteraceae bacterium]|nr:diaminopimelate decarboxylase [Bryobacteraceae bacterium]
MFQYKDEKLYCEEVPLEEIARAAGTPCYVYSARSILSTWRAYDEAFEGVPHLVCYAVKANSSLAVLAMLARAGSGFDIVSGGELFRVLKAGGDPGRVVFSGMGKTAAEIEQALRAGIRNFNCESEAEPELIDSIAAKLGMTARFSLRVNPDVNPETHPYISTGMRDHKFGVDIGAAADVYRRTRTLKHVTASGVSCHIGSQILDYSPILEAAGKVLALIETLQSEDFRIDHVDLGGGLGIAYRTDDEAPLIRDFITDLRERIGRAKLTVMIEPGRSIVGSAGVLLTQVLYRKQSPTKEFVVVDAAMNDLIRPALYKAHHEIRPLHRNANAPKVIADVVGPVCESGDFLARDREMPDAAPGEWLAVSSAGAYGFVQASNYNSRPRGAEVLVDGSNWRVIRTRETFEDLIHGENL